MFSADLMEVEKAPSISDCKLDREPEEESYSMVSSEADSARCDLFPYYAALEAV